MASIEVHIDDSAMDKFRTSIKAIEKVQSRRDGTRIQRSDRIVTLKGSRFAIFGEKTHQILPVVALEDNGLRYEYDPAFIDGQMVLRSSPECPPQVLYLTKISQSGKQLTHGWISLFVPAILESSVTAFGHSLSECNDAIDSSVPAQIFKTYFR